MGMGDDVPGFGERMREARQKRGLSLDGLAREIGCSKTQIQRLETGQSVPRAGMLLKIATELDAPTGWLLTGVGDSGGPMPIPEVFDRFVGMDRDVPITPGELEALRQVATHPPKGRSVTLDYLSAVLIAMRGALLPEEVDNAADTAAKIRRDKK